MYSFLILRVIGGGLYVYALKLRVSLGGLRCIKV